MKRKNDFGAVCRFQKKDLSRQYAFLIEQEKAKEEEVQEATEWFEEFEQEAGKVLSDCLGMHNRSISAVRYIAEMSQDDFINKTLTSMEALVITFTHQMDPVDIEHEMQFFFAIEYQALFSDLSKTRKSTQQTESLLHFGVIIAYANNQDIKNQNDEEFFTMHIRPNSH